MKKITDFIVKKRNFILILFIILSVISAFLSTKVEIEHDISKYLPKTSETKIGMNIMDEEFQNDNTSTLNIMLKSLKSEEKDEAYNYLKNLKNIKEIDYEKDSEDYNKDDYTLYKLTVSSKSRSKIARDIYNDILDHFDDKLVDTSGTISEYNKVVLPFSIIALAVGTALVILIIMSTSYIEPFLFLTCILIAVLLNHGTNIIFSSVSNITNSIAAILQLALSMDYSIMLMERYNQERQIEKDKVKAMENALYHSFKAISSSLVTTIVGLLALIFMSFTIGRDLGFVLAKGVLLSLICIFTILPGLILIFDKAIIKTQKKSPIIKMDGFGKISYKCRYLNLLIFIAIFGTSFLLKGNLGILYTNEEDNKIDEVFKPNNQMVILYPTKDEEKIKDYCNVLENNNNIDDVLCYSNTINMPLKYEKLNDKLDSLNTSINAKDSLIKILYYYYYNKDENNLISLNDLLKFIKSNVYNNEDMNKKISNEMRINIDKLENFANKENINKKRSIKEISDTLNIPVETINKLLIYYNSQNNNTKLTLEEFTTFMTTYVFSNSEYSKNIDENTKNNIYTINKFTNKSLISNELNSKELANIFALDENLVKQVILYNESLNIEDKTLSLSEFTNFVSEKMMNNEEYKSLVNDLLKNKISLLKTFSNKDFINNKLSSKDISILFNLDENIVQNIFKSLNVDNMSPYEFVNVLINNEMILKSLDEQTINNLLTLNFIMNSTINGNQYDYKELSEKFNIPEEQLKNIYILYESENETFSPIEFINFILSNENLVNSLDKNSLQNLTLLKNIMESSLNNVKYSQEELAKFLGIKKETISLIYSLYATESGLNRTISYKDFVSFLVTDVMKNETYSANFSEFSKNRLEILNTIINNSLNDKKYSNKEIYNTLSKLTDDLDENLINLVYIYYGSENDYNIDYSLTIEQFIDFLNKDIITDKKFDDFISLEMKNDIKNGRNDVLDAKDLLVGNTYSRIVLNTTYELEGDNTFNFIKSVKNDLSKILDTSYVVGDSPVAYEISNTFQDELNLITILTIIFIFVVVAITFKSLIIPIILILFIQCAVYLTMGILSFGGSVYFISILIVQSILMGATIDYAILYTSYYLEARKKLDVKNSLIKAYNNSIQTILTSGSILIIVTLIVGNFTSAIASKICKTLSEGSLCSVLLIVILLPGVLALFDKLIYKKNK